MPDDRLDAELVDRYLAGEASLDEQQYVQQWLGQSTARSLFFGDERAPTADECRELLVGWESLQRRFADHRHVQSSLAFGKHDGRKGRSVGRWNPGWDAFKTQPLRRRATVFNRYAAGRILGYAAASALMLVVLVFVSIRLTDRSAQRASQPAMESYATANGQHATVTLSDGTMIILNVASRLQVPMDYGAGDHTVRLTGEALFTVMHHDRHPFIVQAGSTITRVLGTSFVVRHYATDTATVVAVRDGKVVVDSTIVPATHFVSVYARQVGPLLPAQNAQFSFATNVLTLPTMRLSQAILELNRWYDTDIRLADSTLGDQTIEGEITSGSVADLVEKLRVMFNVSVVRNGRTLTLDRK